MMGNLRLIATAMLFSLEVAIGSAALGQAAPSPYTSGIRYDAMGRIVGTISADPDGVGSGNPFLATRITYNTGGLPTKTEKGTLSTWQSEGVDPSNWTGFVVTRATELSYDSVGRKTTELLRGSDSAAYALTQFSYDALGRLECTAVRMNLAAFGSLPASACTLGAQGSQGPDRITRNVYDVAGQRVQVRKAVGTTVEKADVTYGFTLNSKMQYVVDANGNKAQMAYDPFDRMQRWYFPSQTRPSAYNDSSQANALATAGAVNTSDYEEYGYDNNGNRTSLRKRDSSTLGYTYDALNRVTHKGGPIADVDYTYDLQGHQLTATFSTGGAGVTNTYDGFGELKTSMANYQGPALTLTYDYDADGNRCQLTFPDGQVFTYAYDGLDRQAAISQGGTCLSGGGTSLIGFAYDQLGRRSSLGRTAAGSTTYAYDGASRIQTLTNHTSSDQVLTFTYNPASQIVSRAASNDAFAWTGVYNVNRGYTTNGLNQYSAAGGDTFTYDLNGNLKTDTTTTGTTTFTYDGENRLTGASGLITAGLAYDPMGRMVVVNSPSTWTRLVYDGDDLVAEYNGSGTLLKRYLHGTGEDEPLVQYDGSDLLTKRLLHADQQGSVIATTDGSGNILGSPDRYDEYGVPQSTNTGRFQYTGQQWIPEFGMSYYKARFYSPTLGRFMQTDPIGYKDQINLYEYVGDDPVDRVDPTGMQDMSSYYRGWENVAADHGETLPEFAEEMDRKSGGFDIGLSLLPIDGIATRATSWLRRALSIGESSTKEAVTTVRVSRTSHPEAASHIERAQAAGQPRELTVDRAGSASRRREALRDTATRRGADRDEYPPAMFKEGGNGSSVEHINPSDNRGAGASISHQCRSVQDGGRITITVCD
jgi:RHS repeat-associated protein